MSNANDDASRSTSEEENSVEVVQNLLDKPVEANNKSKMLILVAIGVLILVVIAIIIVIVVVATGNNSLENTLDINDIDNHMEKIQEMAEQHPSGDRSILGGYEEVAEYVMEELRENGAGGACNLQKQEFVVPIATQNADPTLSMRLPYNLDYQHNVDFAGLWYGGNYTGTISAPVSVPLNYGCNISDYLNGTTGSIVVIEIPENPEEECSLIDAAMAAEASGASAIVFHNAQNSEQSLGEQMVRDWGWGPGMPLTQLPCLHATFSLGKTVRELVETQAVELEMQVDTSMSLSTSFNVLCTLNDGEPSSTIVIGAHLDSRPHIAGMNANGSGSMALLQITIEWFLRQKDPTNRITFAWWGAKELGEVGSAHFVRDLQQNGGVDTIVCNLNLDTLASPNPVVHIFDGNTTHRDPSGTSFAGSVKIAQIFAEYYEKKNWPHSFVSREGGTDVFSFIEAGIPGGWITSGASELKTEQELVEYGGIMNAMLDPCNKEECDDLINVNLDSLQKNAEAAAYTLDELAYDENIRSTLQMA